MGECFTSNTVGFSGFEEAPSLGRVFDVMWEWRQFTKLGVDIGEMRRDRRRGKVVWNVRYERAAFVGVGVGIVDPIEDIRG